MPGIMGKAVGRDFGREPRARGAKRIDVELHITWAIGIEIACAQMEKPYCRPKPPSVLGMVGAEKLLLQMDKRAGDLDQALEKTMILVMALEPQVLEDVVGFIILPFIEAAKVALVTWMQRRTGFSPELLHKGANAFGFFHRREGSKARVFRRSDRIRNITYRVLCMTRSD